MRSERLDRLFIEAIRPAGDIMKSSGSLLSARKLLPNLFCLRIANPVLLPPFDDSGSVSLSSAAS